MLPRHVIYRAIIFAKGDKVAHLGTTLMDREQYPAAELVALYRERWRSSSPTTRSRTTWAPPGRSDRGNRKASGRNYRPTSLCITRSASSPMLRRWHVQQWTPTVSPT